MNGDFFFEGTGGEQGKQYIYYILFGHLTRLRNAMFCFGGVLGMETEEEVLRREGGEQGWRNLCGNFA